MNIFSIIYLISAMVSFLLAIFLYHKRKSSGMIFLVGFEIAAGIWSLTYCFEKMAVSLEVKEIFAQLAYLGIASAPLFYLAFTLDFAQYTKLLRKKVFVLLSILPFIGIVIVATNQFHHWYWPSISIDPVSNLADFDHGIPFYFFVFYMYMILTAAIVVLFLGLFRFPVVFKAQLFILIIASLLPYISNLMYVTNINPISNLDWTPLSFTLSGALVSYGIYRFSLFDFMPIARHKVMESIRDAVVVFDCQSRIIMANNAFKNIFSFKEGELDGLHFKDINLNLHLKPLMTDEMSIRNTEFTFGDKVFDVQDIPLLGNKEEFIGEVMVFHDITFRKHAEQSLIDTNQKLREEIHLREQLISDLNAFSHSVAHDLKNPISSVVSLSELLQDYVDPEDETAMDLLRSIQTSNEKMLQIVDELLKLASVSKQSIEFAEVDMKEIIEAVLLRLSMMTNKSKAKISYPENWPLVYSYSPWIEEVWANYISNAIKYGGKPPVITLNFDASNSDFVRYTIQDNGNGLLPEQMKKLFQDFSRVGSAKIEGHGLGLSLVKRIVQKLGGSVAVSSDHVPGKGCIFSFT
ncbi:MAG: PAS domain S-box protein, partial [Bacteroidales bacterium]|nr:PAS domain S-box protein [Bacteroidales bacterium]